MTASYAAMTCTFAMRITEKTAHLLVEIYAYIIHSKIAERQNYLLRNEPDVLCIPSLISKLKREHVLSHKRSTDFGHHTTISLDR
jgi:hypothetical protein